MQRLCEKKIGKCEKDCEVDKTESACVPDYNIFKTFRNNIDDVVVKSVKIDEIGGVNQSAWFFKRMFSQIGAL